MLSLFESLEAFYAGIVGSPLGTTLNLTVWLSAVLQAVHLLTLVMIACAVLVVDLRLLGLGLRRLPVARVAEEARPWLVWGLVGQAATGLPLFLSLAASRYYGHPAFHLKMYLLAAALLFTFTVRQRFVRRDERRAGPYAAALVGVVSIALWSGVGIMGKGIAYY
jgi:hypothetical protein